VGVAVGEEVRGRGVNVERSMRTTILAAILFFSLSAAAASVHDQVIALEKSGWEAWKRKDAKAFASMLADDFYDIYLSGEVVGKKELMKGFADSDLLDYRITNMHAVDLSKDSIVLTYRAHVKGRVKAKVLEYDVDVTAAWAIRNGRWMSVFYRENLVPEKLPWTNLAQ